MNWQIENKLQQDIYKIVRDTDVTPGEENRVKTFAAVNGEDLNEAMAKAILSTKTNALVAYLKKNYDIRRT